MKREILEDAIKAKRAIDRAEKANPGCAHVRNLHFRLGKLVEHFRPMLDEADYVALGGGTPKTPNPQAADD